MKSLVMGFKMMFVMLLLDWPTGV